jgi:lipoate-protein ligase A
MISDPQSAIRNPQSAFDLWHRHPLDIDEAAAQVERAVALVDGATPLPALRWYWATRPTLILGVFQPPDSANADVAARHGIPVVRRRSGGTGVLAGPPLLSCDIALPVGHPLAPPDVTESYHWLGAAWLEALNGLGVPGLRLVPVAEVRAAPPYRAPRETPPPGGWTDDDLRHRACFGSLSPYEVAVGPRKLVGLAQVRRRGGVLFQVGLPLTWQADLLADLLTPSPAEQPRLAALLRAHAVGLDELVAMVPSAEAIMTAFEQVLADRHGVILQSVGE